ncbi:MAG: thiamine pyrophosphate-dependent enzyme, partial [Prevotella sp.]
KNVVEKCRSLVPEYSQMYAVKSFEEAISNRDIIRQYANSMSVRLGCIYSKGYIYVNRGINGIEGSLSTAAGYSLATDKDAYCVIGDLSFFYDQNALWNRNIGGNFKILLLNNGGGAIFGKFDGLKESNARDNLVMAKHNTSAAGICSANHINYIEASNAEELKAGLDKFINMKTDSPTVLEVFTDAENDMNVIKEYYTKI